MVQDFYQTHRSLAESYDQIKSESGNHLFTTFSCPFSFTKNRVRKPLSLQENACVSCKVVELDESGGGSGSRGGSGVE